MSAALQLRKADEHDIGLMYAIASTAPELWPRVTFNGLPRPEAFPSVLLDGVSDLFVAESGQHAVGVGSIYDVREQAGIAWIDAVSCVEEPGTVETIGVALMAIIQSREALWKVYARGLAYAPSPLDRFETQVEASLKEAIFHENMLWDERILSAELRR